MKGSLSKYVIDVMGSKKIISVLNTTIFLYSLPKLTNKLTCECKLAINDTRDTSVLLIENISNKKR